MNYPDIFFTPEYARLFEKTAFGGELCHFTWAGIDYNFFKRPIEGTSYFHIISPYGYSGPVAFANSEPLEYLRAFHRFCLEKNIIAEFALLHPFVENYKGLENNCIFKSGEIYYIDLTQPLQCDKACKSSIKKAQRSGIEVKLDDKGDNYYLFAMLYWQTMDQNEANKGYYFSLKHIDGLFSQLNAKLFGAWYLGKMIAGSIILKYNNYAHCFLAGADKEYSHLCPNNLLLSEAIKWSKEEGCKIFNLGEGKDDSRSSFERSFSKLSKPVYTYYKVHNQKVYNELSKVIRMDYFPANLFVL